MSYGRNFRDFSALQSQHGSASSPVGISSTAVAYAVLIAIVTYYIFQYLDHIDLPLSEILWNAVVWTTPSSLISKLDSGFETAMVEGNKDTETNSDPKDHASKSNAMRRILGLDEAGILTSVQRTRTLSNLGSVFKSGPNTNLPGLGNWDNSCYQNSVLQSLAALRSLPGFLSQDTLSDVSQPTKSALRRIIMRLNDPANVAKTLWTPAELKSMSSWQQQDAQEYFSKISDEMEKDSSKDTRRKLSHGGLRELSAETKSIKYSGVGVSLTETTTTTGTSSSSIEVARMARMPDELLSLIERNPLEGLLAQRVGCQKCGYVEGLSLVPFNCLTVPLGRGWMYDVRSCLDEYTALEPINGVECAKCTLLHAKQSLEQVIHSFQESRQISDQALLTQKDILHERLKLVDQMLDDEDFSDLALKKCQIPPKNRALTTKSRQAVIARAPKSLVIHVNRSNFDEISGLQSKNLATVTFPRKLDLRSWCLGNTPEPCDQDSDVESWSTDPSKSMLSDDDSEVLDSEKGYELRAVITHYGRHENGHYICYRKSPYPTQTIEKTDDEGGEPWWRLSDEDVTEVSEEAVLSQGGVFMLFYERSTMLVHPQHQQILPQQTKAEDVSETSAKVQSETESIKNDLPPTTVPDEQSDLPIEPALPTPPPTPTQIQPKTEPPIPAKDAQIKSDSIDTIKDLSSEPSESVPPNTPSNEPKPSINSDDALPKPHEVPARPPQQPPSPNLSKENKPVSPASMRTAAPRGSSGSVSRAGKAMGSVAGFVQAN